KTWTQNYFEYVEMADGGTERPWTIFDRFGRPLPSQWAARGVSLGTDFNGFETRLGPRFGDPGSRCDYGPADTDLSKLFPTAQMGIKDWEGTGVGSKSDPYPISGYGPANFVTAGYSTVSAFHWYEPQPALSKQYFVDAWKNVKPDIHVVDGTNVIYDVAGYDYN